jgi:hypothetical protein
MDLERVITDVLEDGDVESIAFTHSKDRVWARIKLEDDSITTGLSGLRFMLSPYLSGQESGDGQPSESLSKEAKEGDGQPSESLSKEAKEEDRKPTLNVSQGHISTSQEISVSVSTGPPTTLREIQDMLDERKAWVRKNMLSAVVAELIRRNGGDTNIPLTDHVKSAILRITRVNSVSDLGQVLDLLEENNMGEYDREKKMILLDPEAYPVWHYQDLFEQEVKANKEKIDKEDRSKESPIERFDSLHLELAARLDTLMRREELSMEDVCSETGLSQSTIQRFRASVDPNGNTHYLLPSTFRTIHEYITTKTNG